ncbi:tyrosinase family protein [Mesorhizobium sp. M0227]|uniref:tyrosinase family protein n=1 Tax=Mesorhizobium sp. M0227 TaxID=2956922 RepID=UPI00333AC3E5
MVETDNDTLVDHPNWFGQIRSFFTPVDIDHMLKKSIDLGTYNGVVTNAVSIYSQTQSGAMPLDAAKWSKNRVQTFLNWITDNYPLGKPLVQSAGQVNAFAMAGPPARVRTEVSALSTKGLGKLKDGFRGIMARDPSDAQSYFALAGVHWFPAIDQNPLFHCLHHENRFLAWHRIHLRRFEDALRSVPGCSALTLPYWDITTKPPAFLYEEPFAQYRLQGQIGHGYDPLTTSHYPAADIMTNMKGYNISFQIANSLKQTSWEAFNRTFWPAHDNGHVASGTTMENQDISSFDPSFWFYHCNLDRIWLQWQKEHQATTLAGFKSTCLEPTAWLDVPALGVLPPFEAHVSDAIAMADVDYAPPAKGVPTMTFENMGGNVAAVKSFRIDGAAPLSIRVKDINRAAIPGTFVVHLLADGKEVARQAFFQPTNPGMCQNCSQNAKVAVDFRVAPAKVLDRRLSIEIHVPGQRAIGTRFPLSKVGQPTINVRYLVEPEDLAAAPDASKPKTPGRRKSTGRREG